MSIEWIISARLRLDDIAGIHARGRVAFGIVLLIIFREWFIIHCHASLDVIHVPPI